MNRGFRLSTNLENRPNKQTNEEEEEEEGGEEFKFHPSLPCFLSRR